MSSRTWTVIGILAVLALGFIVGHLVSTTGDRERQAWQAETDRLLGEARAQWAWQADSLAAVALAKEGAAKAAADSATAAERGRRQAEATAARLRRRTDSLAVALDSTRTAADSLPVLVALVDNLTAERDSADARAASEQRIAATWKSAYQSQVEASGILRSRIANDSTRIAVLEGQLATAPKADRWKLHLWRFNVRPAACVTRQIASGGNKDAPRQYAIGPSLCVTP